jgi:hypothetical protein
LQLRKIPPQEDALPAQAPSILHFTQSKGGGCQMTSLIIGAFGGWILTLVLLQLNLALFLAYQITFKVLMIAAFMVTLHCGVQALSQSFQISSRD